MGLLSKRRKADMEYSEFTMRFAQAFGERDAKKTTDLLGQRVLCPRCKAIVRAEMLVDESTKDAVVRCSECKAPYIAITD